jgi:PPP family 3-phenylpropionic acid transporter
VFGSTGVASVYFAIWLTNRGISPDEIGIINAVPVVILLCINLLVGRLADKASDWRQVIVILALVAGAVPVGLFFVSGFWGILLLWTLCVVPAFSLVPVIDAATLRMTERRSSDFGVVRAWGTVGYMVSTALAGPVIAFFGEAAFVPLFVVWSLLRALLALQLPLFRAPTEEAVVAATPKVSRFRQILTPWFVLPLVGLGMHSAMHGVLSAFGALIWKQQGISEGLIGPLIAVMAASEAVMMFVWTKLKIKISARHLIIFAALVAAFRWGAMAFNPPVVLLFILQMLHAITFAVGYFGGIYFIANWTSEEIAAEAQGFAYVLQQGMGVIALIGFGWCVALWGEKAWLAASAFAFVGAMLVVISLRLKSPGEHPKLGETS